MDNKWYLVDNEMGLFIRASREAKGYTMEEISHGICSIPTLSRIEAGERVVDYIMIEALLERMKLAKSEYEFVLDEEDYCQYMQREEIRKLITRKDYMQAEEKLLEYEKEHGEKFLHEQFILLHKGLIKKYNQNTGQAEELLKKAISITAPDYQQIILDRGILSDTELTCLVELIQCIENTLEREKKQEELYEYFNWSRVREKLHPIPYRRAMRYYAECLFKNEKFETCITICNEVLKELIITSKLEDRNLIFELRAYAREKIGYSGEEEKNLCLKDFLTAYYVTDFYDEEEKAQKLKKHIEEVYGWQFIE